MLRMLTKNKETRQMVARRLVHLMKCWCAPDVLEKTRKQLLFELFNNNGWNCTYLWPSTILVGFLILYALLPSLKKMFLNWDNTPIYTKFDPGFSKKTVFMSWDRLISREIQVKNKDIHEQSEGMSKFFTLFPHLMKPVKTLIKTVFHWETLI